MSLKSSIQNIVQSILLKKKMRLVRTIDFESLKHFFNSIKPITTNFNLIRIGGEIDGGYLVPDDIDNIEACFSPGVAETANFESALAERGIKSFMADYSVEDSPVKNRLFHFEKKYLGSVNNDVYMTLENWVSRHTKNQNDLILQMDIEGCEYGVIISTDEEILRRFRILVIEFHGLDDLLHKKGFEFINLTFQKLLKNFEIVHIHPNNCSKLVAYGEFEIPPVLEFTFLRKDRISNRKPTLSFPHKLDKVNVKQYYDFALPKCWY